jgi:hypothetical protein
VRIGDEEFLAEVNRGLVSTSVGHDSGGIRIRTERVATDEWLNRLLQALQREAESNQASRMAIENLVMGGRS